MRHTVADANDKIILETPDLDAAQSTWAEGKARRLGGDKSVISDLMLHFDNKPWVRFGDFVKDQSAQERFAPAGFGSGASRLVCGTLAAHERLEEAISGFKRAGAALCFSSGYAAAMGTIPALCSREDVIILDKLCHACLVDAARLSGAQLRVFPHNDTGKLERHLRWARDRHPASRVLVVAESVYSMDGDVAPLLEIVELKERHGAWLFLDEAHGVGVLGAGGRGLAEESGAEGRIEIQMGTLGKALGAHGAYITGSRHLRDFLINQARSFIYSTAPPRLPSQRRQPKRWRFLAGRRARCCCGAFGGISGTWGPLSESRSP